MSFLLEEQVKEVREEKLIQIEFQAEVKEGRFEEEEGLKKEKCQLIDECIDIIRHQQYILDNVDHLDKYDEELLGVWRRQMNLLDSYDRFQYYRQLGRMKQLFRRMKRIGGGRKDSLMSKYLLEKKENNNDNKAIVDQINRLRDVLVEDCQKVEGDVEQQELMSEILYIQCRLKNDQQIYWAEQDKLKRSVKFIEEGELNTKELIEKIFVFIMKLIGIEKSKQRERADGIQLQCELCHLSKLDRMEDLIKHIFIVHLNFWVRLLLGKMDQCFEQSCNHRQLSNEYKLHHYNLKEHLKSCAHSEIYQADRIFSKLYSGCDNALQYFYGKDAKNWRQKFKDDLLEWAEEVSFGAEQYIKDCQMLEKQRGGNFLKEIRGWMEVDEELLRSEVRIKYKDFDQLCFLLKYTWSKVILKENEKRSRRDQSKKQWAVSGYETCLNQIWEKLKDEPCRIHLIEAISDLLDTKQSLIAQFHRYLYLGVFNFKLTQRELEARLNNLEKLIKQLGVFQAVVFNSEFFQNVCKFEGLMCDQEKSGRFTNPLKMFEHYFEFHLGVFQALSDEKLKGNLKEEFFQGRINSLKFEELKVSELLYFLHDYYEADYKTKAKWFLRECRRNFQLKGVCCDCGQELQEFGQVQWKEQLSKRKEIQLKFKHYCTVEDLVKKIYGKQGRSGGQEQQQQQYSEMRILEDQVEIYKVKLFTQMQSEILVDDTNRWSQCNDCNKKLKGFNPLLKELKAEYFQLPGTQDMWNNNNNDQIVNDNMKKKLEIRADDPKFIQTQKEILNRAVDQRAGGSWQTLKEQMEGGYFQLDSFPKLVHIYGEISESVDQNPNRVLSQPILNGYMKVIFQTPLLYIADTGIIYEMQPQWAKIRQQFKLFGSSDLQRAEMVKMLESHPVMQTHTYQLTKLTQLCVDQVDLQFKLNKHLLKQKKIIRNVGGQQQQQQQGRNDEQEKEEDANVEKKLGLELKKTADLLYFEGVLHRAQVQFLIQQFRIWQEVFLNVQMLVQEFVQEQLTKRQRIDGGRNYSIQFLQRADAEISSFMQIKDDKWNNLILMLVLCVFYSERATEQMKLPYHEMSRLKRGEQEDEVKWELLDFIFEKEQENRLRFIYESHLIPIITPLLSQFIHPIFLGTLLQIFQLNFEQVEGGQNQYYNIENSYQYYLKKVYFVLSKLTIKRCIPLFNEDKFHAFYRRRKFEKTKQQEPSQADDLIPQFNNLQIQEEKQQEEEDGEVILNKRRRKLKNERRFFQLEMFDLLDDNEIVDMQCRYVLAKRSLIKVLNSGREDPPIECDLRWAMQIGQMFFSSLRKRAHHSKDEENRVARENVKQLKELKEEADHYFHTHKSCIPEDFLFKKFNQGGQENISDLRALLQEILQDDQKSHINQAFNRNPYKFINKLKIAYFIPMEKKLQDIVACIGKLRSLPHRQTHRSMEKFHRYHFRELELLAFPELFVTGQGFQQHMAPQIERSSIVVEIQKQEREAAQQIFSNLKSFNEIPKNSFFRADNKIINQVNQSETFLIQTALTDFTTQHRKGEALPKPKKAILQLEREDYIKKELSSAYVYDFQKISVIKVFQEAIESQGVEERSFKLEQNIEIKIKGEEVLHESLKNEHVLKNFKQLLKKQQNWSNECQAFVRRITEEVQLQDKKFLNVQSGEELSSNLLDYIRLQEEVFLENKRKELAEEFKHIDLSELECWRKQQQIDLKRTKIKKSKKGGNKKKGNKNSIQDVEEEIHSEIMSSIRPLDEVTDKIREQLMTYSSQYTCIGEDTRFRLVNSHTRVFNNRYSFIFWRYTQRIIQKIFQYYTVVNGINFYEKNNNKQVQSGGGQQNSEFNETIELKEFQKLPPIKGSSTYFKEKYKEQRAICFQKCTPYLFLTYTFNEFERKNYQGVQGLNYFDLENTQLLSIRLKRMDKRKYNQLQKQFIMFFHLFCKAVTQCIMSKQVYFKKNSTIIDLYDLGMYGSCFGYTNRFEYQQRGTIHLHQLLFFQKDRSGQLPAPLLEFWAAGFSLWNLSRRDKDKEFIKARRLEHQCESDCISVDRGDCRFGFPNNLNSQAYWKSGKHNRIFGRVLQEAERRIFLHDRDVVKQLKSSCVIESCGNERIVNYITKYIHKDKKTLEDKAEENNDGRMEKQEKELVGGVQQQQQQFSVEEEPKKEEQNQQQQLQVEQVEEKQKKMENSYKQQASDLVEKVLSKSVTSLSEALADVLDYPLFKTSFTVIKISQVPLHEQFKITMKNVKDNFDSELPDQDLKTQIRSSTWIKYLSRPNELESLNLIEYLQNFVWYGGKTKYKKKYQGQADKDKLYLLDRNGQIVKERELKFGVIINLSQVYYLEDRDYEPNLYYLAMLQLFWPHRQEDWLRETNDSHDGFKKAYYKFYESNEQRNGYSLEGGQQNYIQKFGLFGSYREAVDNYKNLSACQLEFLQAVKYKPKKKKMDDNTEGSNQKLCSQFLTYHLLLRAKNTIIKLSGLLEQEQDTFPLGGQISKILTFLRPDILINIEQRESIEETENLLIEYVNSKEGGWAEVPFSHKPILEELSSLLKSQNFNRLQSLIYRSTFQVQTPKDQKNRTIFSKLENSTESKISQREIQLFSNFEDNIQFPQHFRTSLTRSEFKNLIRPKMQDFFLQNNVELSEELCSFYKLRCNKQQRLAITILLHYLYCSQITQKEGEIINEGCLIHGGGGVGKSFIIQFFIKLFEEIRQPFYILCPTQVAVQNIIKDRIEYSKIVMTIHSFFHLNPTTDIDTSYDHFLAFLRFSKKEHLFKNSTALLYPDLAFYHCMNKVEKFTQKLQGVHCIILEEISMMPPKFLTLLDIYLQVSLSNNLTFGGLQIFAFGDSFQLQPVTNPPAYYFQSHVFQNNYFSTFLELDIPVRQSEDTDFYKNILQPIRFGWIQSHPLYRNSFQLLAKRHLDEKINPETQIALALGLQARVQQLQVKNQITFLYFDNQAVTRENQRRADQHIMYQSLSNQNQQTKEKYRQYINSPARLSFGVKSFKSDILLQNLSEDYDVLEDRFDQEFSSAQHFKLLPLTIRNYILQKLLPLVYERTKWTSKKFAQSFPLYIKLFKNAEIIFRQNLIKELRMINGQAAVIKDINFEVDFKSDDQRQTQVKEKQKLIEQYLANGLIYQADKNDYYRIDMNNDFIQAVREQLEREDLNNINCFMEDEILESEKLELFKAGIQPRIQALGVQIQGFDQKIYLDNLSKYYQQVTVQMPSNQIKGVVREALKLILKLRERLNSSTGRNQTMALIFQNCMWADKNLTHLVGLGVMQNNINSYFFKRAEHHLSQFLKKLDDEWTPMVISQLPINLGYARTIHTSQGATFDNVCVTLDAQHLNRPGLLYTAFSRVRNLQQLFLQGDFNEELFLDVIPEELRRFYDENFIQADEILHSKFFTSLADNQVNDFKDMLQQIKDQNKQLRSKLLKQLPRRQK